MKYTRMSFKISSQYCFVFILFVKNHPWSVMGHFASESRTGRNSTFRGCTLGASEFDAQMSGKKVRKGDGNLRPVYKKIVFSS